MSTIKLKVRQARLDYQQRLGRTVPMQEVADTIGISRAALSLIESNKTWPSRNVLAKLCDFYGLSVSDLLEFDKEGNSVPEEMAA